MSATETHIMIDTETLSTFPNAGVISIGAIKFNPHGDDKAEFETWMTNPELRETLDSDRYFYINLLPSPDSHVSIDTVFWWFQHPEAQAAVRNAVLDENTALDKFLAWIGSTRGIKIWAKSPSADCVWLASAWRRNGADTTPWSYMVERDVRTAQELARSITGKSIKDWSPDGVVHDALVDAALQVYQVQTSFKMLKS